MPNYFHVLEQRTFTLCARHSIFQDWQYSFQVWQYIFQVLEYYFCRGVNEHYIGQTAKPSTGLVSKDLQVKKLRPVGEKIKTYRCLNLPPVGGLNLGMPREPLLKPNFGHH